MYQVSKDLVEYFYNKLPKAYRSLDAEQNYTLKRYLEAIISGAYKPLLDQTLKLEDLFNVEKCPVEYFPYLCASYGVEYVPFIDIAFQRKFLKNFMELNIRKGTFSCIEYLVRELSGFTLTSTLVDNVLQLTLYTYEDDSTLLTKQGVIENYIENYLPVGITALLYTLYNHVDDGSFSPTDEDSEFTLNETMLTWEIISCKEINSSDIIEEKEDSGSFNATDGNVCLTTVVPLTSNWFYSNGYSCVDVVKVNNYTNYIFN